MRTVELLALWLLKLAPDVVASPLTVPSQHAQTRDPCYKYVLINSRATTKKQGSISAGYQKTVQSVLDSVPGGGIYNTNYPADLSSGSPRIGTDDVIRYINQGLAACPQQKYALLGYSQGARVCNDVANKVTGTPLENSIVAIWMLGNSQQTPNQPITFDENGGTDTRGGKGFQFAADTALNDHWVQSGKVKQICYTNDPVCNGYNLVDWWQQIQHFRYIFDQNVQAMGAAWLIPRVNG